MKISQCIIDNIYDAGILGINTNIYVDNSLITNCGSNILLVYGGDYKFTHCTVASFSGNFLEHKNPVLQVYNFATQGNQTVTANLSAEFKNCIFWGEGGAVENEIVLEKQNNSVFNVIFDHVLYKAVNDPLNVTFINPIINQNPLFDSINTNKSYFDFHFYNDPLAPAIDRGINTFLAKDLDDRPRANGLPDLGCYEK